MSKRLNSLAIHELFNNNYKKMSTFILLTGLLDLFLSSSPQLQREVCL